ncbi:MAG: hypothetical protein C0498_08875 [Anaerolinea sp.]|nr:hypothetical protein [Anaerolinea sp.]
MIVISTRGVDSGRFEPGFGLIAGLLASDRARLALEVPPSLRCRRSGFVESTLGVGMRIVPRAGGCWPHDGPAGRAGTTGRRAGLA